MDSRADGKYSGTTHPAMRPNTRPTPNSLAKVPNLEELTDLHASWVREVAVGSFRRRLPRFADICVNSANRSTQRFFGRSDTRIGRILTALFAPTLRRLLVMRTCLIAVLGSLLGASTLAA